MRRIIKGIVMSAAAVVVPYLCFAQESGNGLLRPTVRRDALYQEIQEAKPVTQDEGIKQAGLSSAQKEKVYVKSYAVKGATLLDRAVIDRIVSHYQDRELTFAEIRQVADAITAAYKAQGFLRANATALLQEIKDGIVVIEVNEPKLGEITITGNKNYTTGFISGHIDVVKQDKALNERALGRAVMLLNDSPSLRVSTAFKEGAQPGTTDVVVTVKDASSVPIVLSYDNYGNKLISRNRFNLYIANGSMITEGDNLRLSAITGLDRIDINRYSYGQLNYSMPLDYQGTKGAIYYANTLYDVGGEYVSYKINGKANVAGLSISNPVIRGVRSNLTVKLAFDYKNVYSYMLDVQKSRDKIRTIGLSVSYNATDSLSGRSAIGLTYYRGINNIASGTRRGDPLASRSYADPEFNKYLFYGSRTQKISANNSLIIKASAQYSMEPLLVAEKFSIGGATSVRGFTSSALSGDSGYYASLEFQTSPVFPDVTIKALNNRKIGDMIKFALFVDNGGVYRDDVRQSSEKRDEFLTSMGAGIRIFYGPRFSAKIDYSVPEKDGKYKKANSETNLQTTISF
ncbi:MAG: hypothetical protein A3J24_06660 [Deltaproteobacteria bacterium RIFCSPLOWO2_02_FULL_53_8]|nr:MAG: hypothetical protein A3J24_06660 [Deltaproteobacteria bacterium RIFCSPLOWO2_02_FULL_53_8]